MTSQPLAASPVRSSVPVRGLLTTIVVSLALLGLVHVAHGPRPADASTQAVLESRLGQMPLTFVENRGQVTGPASYYVQGRDKTLYFTPDGLTYSLVSPPASSKPAATGVSTFEMAAASRWTVKLSFEGARRVEPQGVEQAAGVVSYFSGKPSKWKTGLKTYGKLRYERLWPGIDLAYSGTVNRVKYEFVVAPGADPDRIRLAYEGATDVRLTDEGSLEVRTPVASFQDDEPYAYQEIGGKRVAVECRYVLSARGAEGAAGTARYGYWFRVGAYDRSRPLVLDPAVLIHCGYLGGSGGDLVEALSVDSGSNTYVTGVTFSPPQSGFPVAVGPDLTLNSYDAFVAKLNATGTGLDYCGYIGGNGVDFGSGIAVDKDGAAYVTGYTLSTEAQGFPLSVGPDLTHNGGQDAFVAKVNPLGTGLDFCGYLGGVGKEAFMGIAVDPDGSAYLTGNTDSPEASFPEVTGPDLTYNGGESDRFVAKVTPTGSGLDYCGYLGGYSFDAGEGIAVDAAGNAYLSGYTGSNDGSFPVTVGPSLVVSGSRNAFVAKVNAAGSGFVYCGYIAGGYADDGNGIAVDDAGSAYVVGTTTSREDSFPVVGGPDLTYNDLGRSGLSGDGFIAKVNPAGTGLDYCGYIGGTDADACLRVAVDASRSAYVTGYTRTADGSFPSVGGPDATSNGGYTDAFIAKITPEGTGFVYSGFIGGALEEYGMGIAVDGRSNAYVGGWTQSDENSFPVVRGPDLTYAGDTDAFICKVTADPRDIYEPDDTAAAAKNLPPNQVQSRGIHGPGNRDWAKFTLTAARSVSLETGGSSGDTVLFLYGPNSSSTLVAVNNDHDGTRFSRIEQASLAAGTYYVRVEENGNNATLPVYTLTLRTGTPGSPPDQYEADDAAPPARALVPSEVQNRTIHAAGNRDWARFSLSSPSSIALETDGPTGDTILYLYYLNFDGALTPFASNDNRSGSTFSRLTRPLLGPATYYVLVIENGNNATIPAYTLTLRTGAPEAVPDAYEADDTSATAKGIAAGTTQSRSLHATGDRDWAKFTLASTSRVTLETNGSSGDTVLYLYGPNSPATGIASNNDRPGSTFSRIVRPSLGPGTYYVLVIENGNNATIPAYTLRLTTGASPGAPSPTLAGQSARLSPAPKG